MIVEPAVTAGVYLPEVATTSEPRTSSIPHAGWSGNPFGLARRWSGSAPTGGRDTKCGGTRGTYARCRRPDGSTDAHRRPRRGEPRGYTPRPAAVDSPSPRRRICFWEILPRSATRVHRRFRLAGRWATQVGTASLFRRDASLAGRTGRGSSRASSDRPAWTTTVHPDQRLRPHRQSGRTIDDGVAALGARRSSSGRLSVELENFTSIG